MKEYRGKLSTALFWTACGLCAGWFAFNVTGRITHNLLISGISGIVVMLLMLYKVFVCDFISIIITDDRQLLIKRFNKIVKSFVINNYYWSEYSKESNTKNAEDQDIYYVSKETGEEDYIDCSNFSENDYEELLMVLGAKTQDAPAVKVETIKK